MSKRSMAILALCLAGGPAMAGPDKAAPVATMVQEFDPAAWRGDRSNDGIWRINGDWLGTFGNTVKAGLAALSRQAAGDPGTGYLRLTTQGSAACPLVLSSCQMGEVQTLTTPGYSYGYYEVRMQVSCTPGAVQSFFLTAIPYVPPELDIEFLTGQRGTIEFGRHPAGRVTTYRLGYDPCRGFHRYGILWLDNRNGTASLAYAVDGAVVHVEGPAAGIVATAGGSYIMMNSWTGNARFGGGPPVEPATALYDWVKYFAGTTAVVPCTTGSC